MNYLKVDKAFEILEKKERIIYRALEIFPGALSWLTLISLIFFSYLKPVWVAVFVIGFDLYWFLKTIYLSAHLRSAFKKMKKNLNTDWLALLKKDFPKKWQNFYHLIIFPTYKEPYQILKESFESLLESDFPKEKMIVVLACEERALPKAKEIAQKIEKEFAHKFFKFLVTFHPKNIEGEIAGKGANQTWAIKIAKKEIIDKLKIPYENIIVSSFDADTRVPKGYFSCLLYSFLKQPDPYHASYQPVPLFTNNIWEAPSISKIMAFSSSFWHLMNQEREEKHISFSSHSTPFKSLAEIDFWQTNVVSEDSRIFWNLFLANNGNWKVVSLYYPVFMDANVAQNFFKTFINLYKQQRRWAYGCADIAYFLYGFLKNKKIPLSKKINYGLFTIEGFWSWATNSLIIFFGGWLPLILGGTKFQIMVQSFFLPTLTSRILTLAMIGIITNIWLTFQILPPLNSSKKEKIKKYSLIFFQWFLIPFNLIALASIPALEAQTRLMLGKYMGFWVTPKIRKNSS